MFSFNEVKQQPGNYMKKLSSKKQWNTLKIKYDAFIESIAYFVYNVFAIQKRKKKTPIWLDLYFVCVVAWLPQVNAGRIYVCIKFDLFIMSQRCMYQITHTITWHSFHSIRTYTNRPPKKKKKKSPNWMREIHISTIHLCVKYLNLFFFSPFHMCLCMIHQHNITLIV